MHTYSPQPNPATPLGADLPLPHGQPSARLPQAPPQQAHQPNQGASKPARPVWRRMVLLVGLLGALCGPACALGAQTGTLRADNIGNSIDAETLDVEVTRQSTSFATVFDFRAVRFVSSFEAVSRTLNVNVDGNQTVSSVDDTSLTEQAVYRLDVPVLALWDFKQSAFLSYPGTMPHRQSLDLWLRVGAPDISGDRGAFVGGALTYYHTDLVGFSVTFDRWFEPTKTSAISSQGVDRFFEDDATGWVFGVELTIGAGEYALDILYMLLDIDERVRDGVRPSWRALGDYGPPPVAQEPTQDDW